MESTIWFPMSFFGGMVGVIAVVFVLAAVGSGAREKRNEALEYAAWLMLTYPDKPVQAAAHDRFVELSTRQYTPTDAVKKEMAKARLVIEGWHVLGEKSV